MTGRVELARLKLVPEIAAELTVSAAVPVELIVTDSTAGVFSATLPKAMLVEFTLIAVVAAFNVRA